jgi:hypothetical protein
MPNKKEPMKGWRGDGKGAGWKVGEYGGTSKKVKSGTGGYTYAKQAAKAKKAARGKLRVVPGKRTSVPALRRGPGKKIPAGTPGNPVTKQSKEYYGP